MYAPRSNKPTDTRAQGYRPRETFPWVVFAVIAAYLFAVSLAAYVGLHFIDALVALQKGQ